MLTRTFIAVELPDAARAALQAHIARLSRALPRVRFQPPDSLHLTLAFLGELDDERLDAATQAAIDTSASAEANGSTRCSSQVRYAASTGASNRPMGPCRSRDSAVSMHGRYRSPRGFDRLNHRG